MGNDAIDRLTVQKLRQFERDAVNSSVERALDAVKRCTEVHAMAIARGIEVDCSGKPDCTCDALRRLHQNRMISTAAITPTARE